MLYDAAIAGNVAEALAALGMGANANWSDYDNDVTFVYTKYCCGEGMV